MKKIIAGILIGVMSFSVMFPAMETQAAINKSMQTELYTLSTSLKDILKDKRAKVMEEIEQEILSRGWDYEYTIQSIEDINPFKEVDYVELLSAYMSCKNYYQLNQKDNFTSLGDIPLLSYTLSEKSIEELEPKKVQNYKQVEGGKYAKEREIFILEDTVMGSYSLDEDGYYERIGDINIVLERKTTKYGTAVFHVMNADELFEFYGLTKDEIDEDYEKRVKNLTTDTDNQQIYQTIYARTPQFGESINLRLDVANYESTSYQRRQLIEVAKTLVGQVPYQWGGKPKQPGYDTNWWQFNEDNEQIGLDCSGFVQWAYMTVGYKQEIYGKIGSTTGIMNSGLPEVAKEELQIGDIGVKIGVPANHAGIYAGQINGKDMWIHCTSTAHTVVIGEFNFQKFYSPVSLIENSEDAVNNEYNALQYGLDQESEVIDLDQNEKNSIDIINELVYYSLNETNLVYTDEDVYTLAQLVIHEAGNEGLNGWIAVAEVVKNRVQSSLFPNTIPEVVYQKGQFSYVNEISQITPSQEVINTVTAVLKGHMSILNNPDCLYFRNPKITDGIPVDSPVDWGKYSYYRAVGNHAFYLQV